MWAKDDLYYSNRLQQLSQQKKRLNTLKEENINFTSYVADKNIELHIGEDKTMLPWW